MACLEGLLLKISFWFHHDSNASTDPKMMRLTAKYGCAGYGAFWRMIEFMHAHCQGRLAMDDVAMLAVEYRWPELSAMVDDCCEWGLFVCDGGYISSKRLDEELGLLATRREAGKLGATTRWNGKPIAPASKPHSTRNADRVDKREEKEEKEPGRAYGAHVLLSDSEYKTLRAGLGESELQRFIGAVNDYCDSKGKSYKDWSATIRGWARKDGKWRDRPAPDAPRAVACPVCGTAPAGTEGFCRTCGIDRIAWKDTEAVADARMRWQKEKEV